MNTHINGNDLKQSQGKKIALNGKEYDITLDFNGICELEDKYGSLEKALNTFSATFEGMDGKGKIKGGSMKDIRFLLYVMLKHTDPHMTEYEAGHMLTITNMQEIVDSLGEAMTNSMPQSEGEGTEKKVNSPQEI